MGWFIGKEEENVRKEMKVLGLLQGRKIFFWALLLNISLSPLSHSQPNLSLIFSKYISLASTRLGSEHLSMKWTSSPNGASGHNVHVPCDLGFCCILPSSMGGKCEGYSMLQYTIYI